MPFKIDVDKENKVYRAVLSGVIDKEAVEKMYKETTELLKDVKPQTLSAIFDLCDFEVASDIEDAVKVGLNVQKSNYFTSVSMIMPDNEQGKGLVKTLRDKYNITTDSIFVFEGME